MTTRYSVEVMNAYYMSNADRVRQLSERVDTLFDAIAHGDQKHRDWLYAAIVAHLVGRPVPPQA